MNQVIFLLFTISIMVFAYVFSNRFSAEFRKLFYRVIDLVPNFEGNEIADLKSFIFCFAAMLFLLGAMKIIFG